MNQLTSPFSHVKVKLPFLLFITLSFSVLSLGQNQPSELIPFSHTEFIEAIRSSEEAIFELENAFIYFDKERDLSFQYESDGLNFQFAVTDTLVVDIPIRLKNVHFEHNNSDYGLALHHIKFKEDVNIIGASSLVLSNCVFEKKLNVDVSISLNPYIDYFETVYKNYANEFAIDECVTKGDVIMDVGTIETFSAIFVTVKNTKFQLNKNLVSSFSASNIRAFEFYSNTYEGSGFISLFVDKTGSSDIIYNDFGEANVTLFQSGNSSTGINRTTQNIFRKAVLLEIEEFKKTDSYQWNEWGSQLVSSQGYMNYITDVYANESLGDATLDELYINDSLLNTYKNTHKFQLETSFKSEKRLIGSFYDFYKSQYDRDFANDTYVALKDLETKRYEFIYKENPTFKSYFTWKINQFLKIFSSYGTEPSKSVIMSIYVIFIFAFIYLFFPNSWDTINKNSLMKRIKFYTRYFRNKESMKEIYAEDKKEELMTFQEFKEYMLQSKKETPSYFLWLAKPVYYFSSTNYKITSRLFDKTDILKGKWVDLPRNKRVLSSIFMGIWIIILLCFDLLLKFINALTLSLNTFTTLGFGEIPTKGLPRYLSIIQGFIGWFMLSIFSVSLISQLLN